MHLETAVAPTERNALIALDITEDANGFSLSRDGVSIRGPMPGRELAPAVHREALLAAYEPTDCLAALHAGAVRNEHGCLHCYELQLSVLNQAVSELKGLLAGMCDRKREI